MQYWWVPFLAAAIIGVLLGITQLASKDRFRTRIESYRRSYLELVRRLEGQTILLNRLATVVAGQHDNRVFNHYEACIKLFEDLLTAVVAINPFGQEKLVLDSAHYLQRDFGSRLKLLEEALRLQQDPGRGPLMPIDFKAKPFPLGCFFCSRPFIYSGLVKVKAKVEGQTQQVHSCTHCREELLKERKVRILYFLKDDKPVHWSEVKEYNPVHDFWDIHRKNVAMKPTKLEVIYSRDPGDPLT